MPRMLSPAVSSRGASCDALYHEMPTFANTLELYGYKAVLFIVARKFNYDDYYFTCYCDCQN